MRIHITGSANGIGRELSMQLMKGGHEVIGLDIDQEHNATVRAEAFERYCSECIGYFIPMIADVRNIRALCAISDALLSAADNSPIDVIINNAGVNILDWIVNLEEEDWDRCMDTNAKSIFNTFQAFMPHFGSPAAALDTGVLKGTIINILSNAAERPMTNSLFYNASKAAAKMMTLQMARELQPLGMSVFGIAPNKVTGTNMSRYVDAIVPELRGWTQEEAKGYEAKNLPAGETPVAVLAEYICFILSAPERHKHLTGTIIPYGY